MTTYLTRSVSLFLLLFLTYNITAVRCSELTEITVLSTTEKDLCITLHILGTLPVVHETDNFGGLMIFDFPSLKSTILNRESTEGNFALQELRWSQFSFEPLIFRLVLKPNPLWECHHFQSTESIEISCVKQIVQNLPFAKIRGINLSIPLDGFTVNQIIKHSIGNIPTDFVRDGLPHFGSLRDDWLGKKARKHKGLDIYSDKIDVIAAANGTVVKTGVGLSAGNWVRINHGKGVETVYVHLKNSVVKSGQHVVQGQKIAGIDGPTGNALEPQLHFEIKLDGTSVDPMLFILAVANPETKQQIKLALKDIQSRKETRDEEVERLLEKK